ncbi:TonB-dependent receptor [Stakelama sediminis]|uniref:TonB-dependent receptor n=1 Tax=Stakelama sediminis TaxID=463200 RepID=A0A840Z1T3_9SPHN|nr:TonB-dependent receptor [Stakelama sediminis]MBB5719727.1 TonB-dependent receptor [Stakelama sediminis]
MKLKAFMLASPAIIAMVAGGTAHAQTASPTPGYKDGKKDIVVTGNREDATAIKKDAPIILDIRSQKEIASLPDVNAAEALQRLPGIQMESDSGEGRFINIRGLAADLNATTYDGVRLTPSNPASPQGGSRAVAFDAFPAGILGGLEVAKSVTPAMDAEGLGGTVNILPREIDPRQSLLISGGGALGVETLRNSRRYQGNITFGAGFGGTTDSGAHHVSLTLSYAYDQDQRGINDVEADYINDPTAAPAGTGPYVTSKLYDDLQPRLYDYHRTRQGVSGSLVFRPDDSTRFFVRGLYSGYVENAYKHEYQLNGLADAITSINSMGDVTGNGVTAKQVVISTREVLGNDLIEAGGQTTLDSGVTIDGKVAYTNGHDEFPYSMYGGWSTPNTFSATYNNVVNPAVPSYHTNGGVNLNDPSIYTSFGGDNRFSHVGDHEWSGTLNVGVPVGFGEDAKIQFGASARLRKRVNHQYQADFIDPNSSYADFSQGADQIFYGGAYNIGPTPIYSKFEQIAQGPLVENLAAYYNDKENIYGGYLQYSGTFGKLSVIGGLRLEATRATYRVDPSQAAGSPTATHNYSDLFPDISLRYKASPDFLLRGAYSTTIARPGFNQISATSSVSNSNGVYVLSSGNPDLQPTIGHNFDAAAEYYTPGGGVLSATFFYDQLSNYIIPTIQRGATSPLFPAGQTGEIDGFQDIGSAHVYGAELQLRQQFLFLPSWWSGFGFDGNITLLHSHGAIHQDPNTLAFSYGTLPQTSNFAYNATLFYEKGPVDAHLSGSYVSKNIFGVGDNAATDIYSQPRFRLDADVAYAFSKQLSVFVSAKNITNTKLAFTQSSDPRYPIQREYYQTDYMAGIKFNFGH